MSHLSASAAGAAAHDHAHDVPDLSPANTTLAAAGVGSTVLLLVGVIGLGITVAAGFLLRDQYGLKHALAAYHVGVMSCLAMSLGCLFWLMAFHLTQAGWSVAVRRQFENVVSVLPIIAAMVVPVLVIEMWTGGHLFAWMNKVASGDVLLQNKSGFLNPTFFTVRALIYIGLWSYLAWRLVKYSTDQDATGNKWLTNQARFTSSWGMVAFALSTAFAAFDWLMSMDYRYFSTMWGVYYFAGAAYSSIPVVVLVLLRLRAAGKLKGIATAEHTHDMGKLMFGFTVFWAYIGFGQYFLTWYANIPEETEYWLFRKDHWPILTMFLVVGHFAVPFYLLLWRRPRRDLRLLAIFAVWAIFCEVMDITWIVRPMVYAMDEADKWHFDRLWLDLAGAVGVLGIFFGLVLRRVAKGPLLPLRDPRLAESLHHRNYV
jgi:hypothetical protein